MIIVERDGKAAIYALGLKQNLLIPIDVEHLACLVTYVFAYCF